LRGAVDGVKDQVSRELGVALKELLDQKMTERLMSENVKPENVKKELKDYLQIAARIGLDPNEYLKTWSKTYIDQGLFAYDEPEKLSLLNKQLSEKDKQEEEQDKPEEETEDYVIAALRAAYMAKIFGNWRASLRADYKIRKIKNKMIKLGIYYQELNEKVQKEAELIAVTKIMEMLNEAFLERATLYRLAGPAYKMIETKILSLIKNAKRLHMDITEYDFNALRDKANVTVFDIAKRELHLTLISLSVKETRAMRDKKQKLVALLRRLKEESHIMDDIGASEEVLRDKIKLSI